MVVVEAMAAGVPTVVGERSGALPWIVGDGASGALVDVRRPESIAAAIEALLTDQYRWSQSSKYAFENASSRFRLGQVVDAYQTLYRSVAT